MPRPIAGQVVVITGASSGIGRETALEFGRKGATVVLVARNEEALATAASEVERAGGTAYPMPADVSRWEEVERVAAGTIQHSGRIDTWINCAAVSEYATVEQTDPEEFQRVIDVNLLGQIYGCKAVLPRMKAQGYGTIINVASVLAARSVPLQAAYCASKHGVKGFTEALRLEVERETPDIHVCLVMPSSMNTPLFEHARSKVGVLPRPISPVYEPRAVAETLTALAESPRRDVVVGGAGKLLQVMERLSPGLVDWYMLGRDRMAQGQLTDSPDNGRDNLFEPTPGAGVTTGEFGRGASSGSAYTRYLELHPRRKAVAALAAMAGLAGITARALR